MTSSPANKPRAKPGFRLTNGQIAIVTFVLLLAYFLFFNGSLSSGSNVRLASSSIPEHVKKNPTYMFMLTKLREFQTDIGKFWLEHGIDKKHGGFYGTLDRQGKPASPSYKGLIQQTRHLASICYLAEHFGRNSKVDEAAESLYTFIKSSFLDTASDNFFYIVSPDGKEKLEPGKQLYANMHAVSALALYGRVYKNAEAVEMAVKAFNYWDKHCHDTQRGGWDESKDVPKLKSDDARTVKGVDTHLHVLEALLQLHKAANLPELMDHIRETYDVFISKFMHPETSLITTEFTADWEPLPEAKSHVSYGHDFTALWLLTEASKVLGDTRPDVVDKLVRLGQFSMDRGYDGKLGGFFEYGSDDGTVVSRDHVWWVQCQGMLAAWKMYQLTCQPVYLAKLKSTIELVDQYLRDKQYGEWYWAVTEFGEVSDRGTNKGNEWKSSLHTMRATVLLDNYITEGPVCKSNR